MAVPNLAQLVLHNGHHASDITTTPCTYLLTYHPAPTRCVPQLENKLNPNPKFLLEVTKTVNPSSIRGSTLKKLC